MSDDQWFRDALTATDGASRPGFQNELRGRLSDEWHGRTILAPERLRPRGRPWWTLGAAAAAVVALVVTGLVWLGRRGDDSRVTPPTDTAPNLVPTAPPSATTAVVTTVRSSSIPPSAATGGLDGPVMFGREWGPDEANMDALMTGALDLQGDCLFLHANDHRALILWQYGTGWDAASGAVVTPDGTQIRLLDTFEAGGGFAGVDQLGIFASSPEVSSRAAECAELVGTAEVAVVQDPPTVADSAVGEPRACYSGVPIDQVAAQFVDTLIAARTEGSVSLTADCLSTTPELFTGSAPACWEPCTPRVFNRDSVRHDEIVEADGSRYWSVPLPVSYDTPGGYVDVIETWQFRPVDGAWKVTLAAIDPPLPQRAESLAAINQYLRAIAESDWEVAADLLSQGGGSPEDRADIRQLTPQSFDRAGIAAALEAWCAAGCDTTPADDDALEFTGGYELTINGQTIRATWFEGHHGVYGPPPLMDPRTPAQTLAGWPSPPLADPIALDTVPYLLPSLASDDMPGIAATRSDGINSSVGLYPRYHQIWFDTERATVLHVETVLNSAPTVAPEFRSPVDVVGWDEAFLSESADPVVNLVLGTPAATVNVRGIGMTEDEVIDAARSLLPRPAGEAGWDLTLVQSSAVAFGEGWDTDYAGHLVRWRRDDGTLVGELQVGYGLIGQAMTNQHWADSRQFTDLDGALAVVTDTAGTVAITWRPEAGVTALFGWHGPVDEALAIADSLYRLDRSEWEALVPPNTSTDDGCQSLFC
jgi:hypothetical protein